jgi:hypothetical protein
MNAQHKWQPEDALDPEYIARVLGNPRVTVTNARATAEAVEVERAEYAKSREQRLCDLLRLCLPYMEESRQGRGDKALEKLIQEELK